MKIQSISSNAFFQRPVIKGKLLLFAWIIPMVLACNEIKEKNNDVKTKDLTTTKSATETFQELGFFGPVKDDKWTVFLQAVENNIRQSRKEQGNLSFNMYQPEDRRLEPIWFERFESKKAHEYHKTQDYFKDAITVMQNSLAGEAKSILLKHVEEIPVKMPASAIKSEKARYVIVLFDVRPESSASFIKAFAGAIDSSRQAQGNLELNMYRYEDDPNKFVLIEGWESQHDHETQLQLGHVKRLNNALNGLLVSNPINTRWILKDISSSQNPQ